MAETLIRGARQHIDRALKDSRSSGHLRVVDIGNRILQAKSLLADDHYPAAQEEASSALVSFRVWRDWMISEDRKTVRLEIRLVELMGQIAEAAGDLRQAEQYYRELLDIQQQNLQAQKEPSQFIVTTRLMGQKGQFEPSAFCSYIETQQRLARVLLQFDRPYEAEYRLGQCHLASCVISADRPHVLRYRIAEANTWALASQVIRSRRLIEAEVALDHAGLIWREAIAQFPHAAEYHSGVQGLINDMAWFRSILDEERSARLEVDLPQRPRGQIRAEPDIAFRHDASGRSWYDAGKFEEAIKYLEKSADMREADHAYAWFHLARVHLAVGNREDATRLFLKADEKLTKDGHPELMVLRESVVSQLNGNGVAERATRN